MSVCVCVCTHVHVTVINYFFETGYHYVALAGLGLATKTWLALNSQKDLSVPASQVPPHLWLMSSHLLGFTVIVCGLLLAVENMSFFLHRLPQFPRWLLPFLSAVVFCSLVSPSLCKSKCSSALSHVSNTDFFIQKGKGKLQEGEMNGEAGGGRTEGGGFQAPTRRVARHLLGCQACTWCTDMCPSKTLINQHQANL